MAKKLSTWFMDGPYCIAQFQTKHLLAREMLDSSRTYFGVAAAELSFLTDDVTVDNENSQRDTLLLQVLTKLLIFLRFSITVFTAYLTASTTVSQIR